MEYPETPAEAEKHAKSALSLMDEQRIPAYPSNFDIWYAYFSGRYPELASVLDALLRNKQAFTDQRNAELYEQFFSTQTETEVVTEAGASIEAAVSQVLQFIGQAGDDTNRYGKALTSYSGQLDKTERAEDLREIVSSIMSETRRMEKRHKKLEEDLGSSSQEITELREKLRSVRRQARIDPLTGLANRKHFDSRLRQLVREARDQGEPLSLLMIDIDHFKAVNDKWGHLMGDHVLKLVSRMMVESIKGRDLAARYGGEEFAIILPQTLSDGAMALAEQVRATIADKEIVIKKTGQSVGTVTISLGVATYRDGESLVKLIRRADKALYAAKAGGRNCVVSEAAIEGGTQAKTRKAAS